MYRQWVHCNATSHTILNWSFWNFVHVFSWVCRSARGLDMIFKFYFCTLSTLTLSFSEPQIYESVQTVDTFWAQFLMHHMRKCICFQWNSYIHIIRLKFLSLFQLSTAQNAINLFNNHALIVAPVQVWRRLPRNSGSIYSRLSLSRIQGILWNTSRYPYLDISDLQSSGKNNSINHI